MKLLEQHRFFSPSPPASVSKPGPHLFHLNDSLDHTAEGDFSARVCVCVTSTRCQQESVDPPPPSLLCMDVCVCVCGTEGLGWEQCVGVAVLL